MYYTWLLTFMIPNPTPKTILKMAQRMQISTLRIDGVVK